MINLIRDVISSAIKPVTELIDNMHTSKEEKILAKEKLERTKNELTLEIIETYNNELEAQKAIILAEAQGKGLKSQWRPILMLTIVAIVANNYIIAPYLSMFTDKVILLELPDKLWNLMIMGVGGYIAGRTGEKITETIKK